MKKFLVFFSLLIFLNSCIFENPDPEKCVIQEITVTEIKEGTSNDIVFKDGGTDYFYINRGLEKGLKLESLKSELLNKKVTLHLPKFWIGTSEHIAQLVVNDVVIYTEFEQSINKN